jgi:hypothetical protein
VMTDCGNEMSSTSATTIITSKIPAVTR